MYVCMWHEWSRISCWAYAYVSHPTAGPTRQPNQHPDMHSKGATSGQGSASAHSSEFHPNKLIEVTKDRSIDTSIVNIIISIHHTYTHACIHTYIHTYIHIYIHTVHKFNLWQGSAQGQPESASRQGADQSAPSWSSQPNRSYQKCGTISCIP